MKTQILRYSAVAGDAARSIILMQHMPLITTTDGPRSSPRRDKRFVWDAWASVNNTNGVIGGAALSIVTLSGQTGVQWLLELETDIQGAGHLIRLKHPLPVEYGIGVMVRLGCLNALDEVQVGCVYD